jgi:twitching motility protein PilT
MRAVKTMSATRCSPIGPDPSLTMNFEQLLKFAVDQKASDIHIQAGSPPMLRIGASLRGVEGQMVDAEKLRAFLKTITPPAISTDLDTSLARGAEFTHTVAGLSGFRGQVYSHLGQPGVSLRVVPLALPSLDELNLPASLREIAGGRGGIVLVAGEAGSGRSTTMTALIDLINTNNVCKIITIEAPIEHVHASKKSLVSHRAVGTDTPSFEQGLEQALRQDPDVLVLGRVPDGNTLRLMLSAAEGGRRVIAVVDGPTAVQTIQRVIDLLPPDQRKAGLNRLAACLDAVIAQRLATTKDGRRRPAVEVLRGGPVTLRALTEGRAQDLPNFMAGRQNGMQTFDQHLTQLYQAGAISGTEAMHLATSPEAVMTELRTLRASAPPPSQG